MASLFTPSLILVHHASGPLKALLPPVAAAAAAAWPVIEWMRELLPLCAPLVRLRRREDLGEGG